MAPENLEPFPPTHECVHECHTRGGLDVWKAPAVTRTHVHTLTHGKLEPFMRDLDMRQACDVWQMCAGGAKPSITQVHSIATFAL